MISSDQPELEIARDLSPSAKGAPFLLSPCGDLSEIRVVVCGHSHLFAIATAFVIKAWEGDDASAIETAHTLGIAALIGSDPAPSYLDAIKSLVPDRKIAVVWSGNQAISDFLFVPDQPFDFIPRGFDTVAVLEHARLVPESMVRSHFASTLKGFHSFLAEMSILNSAGLYVLGTPPSLGNDDLIRSRLMSEPHLVAIAEAKGEDLATIKLMPRSVRRKLWFTLQGMMAEIASEFGAIFVPVPDGAFDEEGFLKVDLSQSDVSHANYLYGRLMTHQMAEFLKS